MMKNKKVWLLLTIGVLTTLVVGCTIHQQDDQQIEQITNLAQILEKTATLAQQFQSKEITLEQYTSLSLALEDKYEELTHNYITGANDEIEQMQKNLTTQFAIVKKTIDSVNAVCNMPDRAVKLGLTIATGLTLEKSECKQTYVNKEGFDSVRLTYTGDYVIAIQQAQIIAEKAKIPVSAEFKMAQESLSGLTKEEISQITSGSMLKGIIYTNVGLLATTMNYLITISVDEAGKLTIEATNYSQMKK